MSGCEFKIASMWWESCCETIQDTDLINLFIFWFKYSLKVCYVLVWASVCCLLSDINFLFSNNCRDNHCVFWRWSMLCTSWLYTTICLVKQLLTHSFSFMSSSLASKFFTQWSKHCALVSKKKRVDAWKSTNLVFAVASIFMLEITNKFIILLRQL